MHELSIANSILQTVLCEKEKNNYQNVSTIGIEIGEFSGILADSLLFSFDAMKTETPLAKTILLIKNIPTSAICNLCENRFIVNNLVFSCPICKCSNITMEHGQELDIAYIEID